MLVLVSSELGPRAGSLEERGAGLGVLEGILAGSANGVDVEVPGGKLSKHSWFSMVSGSLKERGETVHSDCEFCFRGLAVSAALVMTMVMAGSERLWSSTCG